VKDALLIDHGKHSTCHAVRGRPESSADEFGSEILRRGLPSRRSLAKLRFILRGEFYLDCHESVSCFSVGISLG
jgi:hypothetical protein